MAACTLPAMLYLLVGSLRASHAWPFTSASPSESHVFGGFHPEITELDPKTTRVNFLWPHGAAVTWGEVMKMLQSDDASAFRELLSWTLKQMPHESFYWECTPLNPQTMDKSFEYVAIDAPGLAKKSASARVFASHLNGLKGTVKTKTFQNLGKSSWLVSPAATTERIQYYAHIGSFFRQGIPQQHDEVWRSLGAVLLKVLHGTDPLFQDRNIWVSTEGSGVPWVHVRVDPWPKYYHWQPYLRLAHDLRKPKRQSIPDSVHATSSVAIGDDKTANNAQKRSPRSTDNDMREERLPNPNQEL